MANISGVVILQAEIEETNDSGYRVLPPSKPESSISVRSGIAGPIYAAGLFIELAVPKEAETSNSHTPRRSAEIPAGVVLPSPARCQGLLEREQRFL